MEQRPDEYGFTRKDSTEVKLPRNTFLAAAALALASGVMMQAQPPRGGGPAPDFTAIKAYLNLTDAQVTSLHDLNKSQRDASQSIMSDLRTKHQALNTAMRSGSTDSASIAALAQAVQAGEQKMQSLRLQYQSQAVATLTAEQQAKLKVLTDAAALMPNVHQASMLNLLTPPQGGGGPGGGGSMAFRRGPGGPGGPPPPADQE
jgi:Spy/CpxP family protein refolding chaperone